MTYLWQQTLANPAPQQGYAVVLPDGSIEVRPTIQAAISDARAEGLNPVIDGTADGGFSPNPGPSPQLAAKMVPVRISERALQMSLEESFTRLQPFFPRTSTKGTPIGAYKTPEGMRRYLLGQNYKTQKQDPRQPSDVQGLSLLPNVLAQTLSKRHLRVNTCVGASKECIASCLVYSGRNEADPYNVKVKFSRTQALLRDPEAFGRMLYESCRHHAFKRSRFKPYVRLNVFSDVPWEIVFPSLFEALPSLQFYDYTKVPGRPIPRNYDLTFSFSGRNISLVDLELRRGRRCAVVFMVKRWDKKTNTSYMPPSWRGYPVIDGDISDVRPLDPAPVVVGLAYKRPKGAGVDQRHSAFVVKVDMVGGMLTTAVTPGRQPGVQ